MITIKESTAAYKRGKPLICPKCRNGTLGYMSEHNKRTVIERRGKPPPDESDEGVQVKCPVCGKLWTLTTEYKN